MTKSDILTFAVTTILGLLAGKLISWLFTPVVSVIISMVLMGYVLYAYIKAPK